MKSTKNILLFIGTAALSASFFGLINGDAFIDHLMTITSGSCLIYGYFQLKNQETISS